MFCNANDANYNYIYNNKNNFNPNFIFNSNVNFSFHTNCHTNGGVAKGHQPPGCGRGDAF